MTKVLICTPAYGGNVTIGYMTSVLRTLIAAPSRGYEVGVFTNTDSLITRARNNAVATFLDSDWDVLFWVDGDISFEPEQFYRVLDANRDVAVGIYPLKQLFVPQAPTPLQGRDLEASMLRYAVTLDGDVTVPEDGFVRVREAATGFMAIRRSVFERMIQEMEHLRYNSDQVVLGAPESGNHFLFFDTMVEGGRYLSEDYAFCRRAQSVGVEIWADLRSELVHTGPYEFRGSVQDTNNAAIKMNA